MKILISLFLLLPLGGWSFTDQASNAEEDVVLKRDSQSCSMPSPGKGGVDDNGGNENFGNTGPADRMQSDKCYNASSTKSTAPAPTPR